MSGGRSRACSSRSARAYPFRITGVHTLRRGSAYSKSGLPVDPAFGPRAASVDDFLDKADAEVLIEVTTLEPATGEPAIGHIRAAFARGMHVITANKGPIAHAYRSLREEARLHGVEFRYESTCMDGAPVFNMVRNDLPGRQNPRLHGRVELDLQDCRGGDAGRPLDGGGTGAGAAHGHRGSRREL